MRRQPTPPKSSAKIQILSNADQQIISNLQEKLAEQKVDITNRTNSLQELRGKMELISSRMKGFIAFLHYFLTKVKYFYQANKIRLKAFSKNMTNPGEG